MMKKVQLATKVSITALLVALFAFLLASCAPPATSLVEPSDARVYPGEWTDVHAMGGSDSAELKSVQVAADIVQVTTHLPEGYTVEDVFIYDEDRKQFNEENGLYSINEQGEVGNGWCLVVAELLARNETSEEVRLDLSNMRLGYYDDQGDLASDPTNSEPWVLGGAPTKEHATPLLAAQTEERYTLGFFVPIDKLPTNKLLILEDKELSAGNGATTRVVELDDLVLQ